MSPDDSNSPENASPSAGAEWFTLPRFCLWLGVFIFLAFFPILAGGESFYFFDYGVLGYPFAYHHHQAFWRGELFPLWNPLSNCGAPFLAQWGTMTLYPGALIYLLLPLPWSLGFFCLVHLFLGGVGMYRLADAWSRDGFAASVAGMAYAFSGAVLASMVWPNWLVALGWMPWVVWLVERAWREGGRLLLLATLTAALQMMSGVPEIILFTWLILLALGIAEFLKAETPRATLVRRTLVIVTLVTALSAAQLLPFLDLLANSHRHAGFATSKWSMPLDGWANLLVPLFHNGITDQGGYIQPTQQFLYSYYLGAGTLLLALFAIVRVRGPRALLLGGVALFGLVMAWGEAGHLYSWLRTAIPILGVGRYAVKFVFLTAFAVPLLAAVAIAHFQKADSESGKGNASWLIALSILLLLTAAGILWSAGPWSVVHSNATERLTVLALMVVGIVLVNRISATMPRRLWQLGLLALLCIDGITHKPALNPTIPALLLQPGAAQVETPPRIGEARVMIAPAAEKMLLNSPVSDAKKDITGKRLALWSNLNLLDEIPKVNGSSTLQLRWQREVQDVQYATNATEMPRLADFLGVSLVTSPSNAVTWVPRTGALPWATIGHRPIFADATNTLAALRSTNFNPAAEVYLPLEARSAITTTNTTSAKIISQKFSAERIELTVDSPQASMLVIAQTFHHPWHAYVDGQRTPIWRANYAFQALEVPAGAKRVDVIYEDARFRGGMAITVVALVGSLGALARLSRKKPV